MRDVSEFAAEKAKNIERIREDADFQTLSGRWLSKATALKYVQNFTWLGRPIIQMPQDLVAMQEIVWNVRPDLIVETGIAHGGSLIFYASLLQLIGADGVVVGVDIEIREPNLVAVTEHPLAGRITMIQGSSTDGPVVTRILRLAQGKHRPLVILDSNHTHDHVLRELELYSPLVRRGSYLVVFDTVIEDLPEGSFPDRPWGKGNNPRTAVEAFLRTTDRFVVDKQLEGKLLITAAPGGYLKCVRD